MKNIDRGKKSIEFAQGMVRPADSLTMGGRKAFINMWLAHKVKILIIYISIWFYCLILTFLHLFGMALQYKKQEEV